MKEVLSLKLGEKITILKSMDLVPTCYYGTILSYYYDSYAQYNNCLYINIKLFRQRKVTRIVLLPSDTFFIFSGKFDKCWNKENISDTESLLYRWSYNDFKNNKRLIFYHEYGKEFLLKHIDFIYVDDCFVEYLSSNNLNDTTAINDNKYIDVIRDMLSGCDIRKCKDYFSMYGYSFSKCLNKALNIYV